MKKIALLILFICFACCGNRAINGIEVSELLLIASKKQNIEYAKLLNDALNGNDSSIRQLALLKIPDGAGYDHSAVVVDLIELIGEDKFIHSLTTISNDQKGWIEKSIGAGLEYGNNPNLQTNTLKEVFPKLYEFLKTKE